MKKQLKLILFIFLGFAVFLLLSYFIPPIVHESDKEYDLCYNTETLPEDELDRLLSERGIDAGIIAALPIWEKQYLIDWNVDMASFGEDEYWNMGTAYGLLPKEKFTMQMIVARIWQGIKEPYPMYRIVILYEWDKLPFWTKGDDLLLWFGDSWLYTDERKVDYVRDGDGRIQQAKKNSMCQGSFTGIAWTALLRRKFHNTIKDGYAAVTLFRKRDQVKEENEVLELYLTYSHIFMRLKRGAWLTGQSYYLVPSARVKHCMLKKKYVF